MRQFITLLLASWLSKVLFLLGIASALATYVPSLAIPTWIPLVVLVMAIFIASYDVYQKQRRKIEVLQTSLASQTKEPPLSPGEIKMRQILDWKGKGITVRASERLTFAGLTFPEGESVQFTVEDCAPSFVTLGYGSKLDTIPLQRVEISFDNNTNRLRLEVRAR